MCKDLYEKLYIKDKPEIPVKKLYYFLITVPYNAIKVANIGHLVCRRKIDFSHKRYSLNV